MEFIASAQRNLVSYWSLAVYFVLVGLLADAYAAGWVALTYVAPAWVFFFAGGTATTIGVVGVVTSLFVSLYYATVPNSTNAGVYSMQALHGALLEFMRCAIDCASSYTRTTPPTAQDAAAVRADLGQLARSTKAIVLASHALLGGEQVYVGTYDDYDGGGGVRRRVRGARVPLVPNPVGVGVVDLTTACTDICTLPSDGDDAHRIMSASYHTIVKTLVRLFISGSGANGELYRTLYDHLVPVGAVLTSAYTAPAARPEVFNWFIVGTIYLIVLAVPLLLVNLGWYTLAVYPLVVWIFTSPMVVRHWIALKQRTVRPFYDVRAWTRETLDRLDAICAAESIGAACPLRAPAAASGAGAGAAATHTWGDSATLQARLMRGGGGVRV